MGVTATRERVRNKGEDEGKKKQRKSIGNNKVII
jgi:hypothetical protein